MGIRTEGVNVFSTEPVQSFRFLKGVHDLDNPTTGETISAAFQVENDVVNVYNAYNRARAYLRSDFDPNFHMTIDMIKGTSLENRMDIAAGAQDQEHLNFLIRYYDRELKARNVLAQSGSSAIWSSILAGVLSPVNIFAFGAGAAFGSSFLRGGMIGLRAGVVGAGLQEAILSYNQEFRTLGESVINISAGAFLGGVFGSIGGKMGGAFFRRSAFRTQLLIDAKPGRDFILHDGVFYIGNQTVRRQLQKQRLAAFRDTGRDLGDLEIEAIYRTFGDQTTDPDKINGFLNQEGAIFLASRALNEADTVTLGFDPTIRATEVSGEQLALRDPVILGAVERQAQDIARAIPIRPRVEVFLTDQLNDLIENELNELAVGLNAILPEDLGVTPHLGGHGVMNFDELSTMVAQLQTLHSHERGVVLELTELLAKMEGGTGTIIDRARISYLRTLMRNPKDIKHLVLRMVHTNQLPDSVTAPQRGTIDRLVSEAAERAERLFKTHRDAAMDLDDLAQRNFGDIERPNIANADSTSAWEAAVEAASAIPLRQVNAEDLPPVHRADIDVNLPPHVAHEQPPTAGELSAQHGVDDIVEGSAPLLPDHPVVDDEGAAAADGSGVPTAEQFLIDAQEEQALAALEAQNALADDLTTFTTMQSVPEYVAGVMLDLRQALRAIGGDLAEEVEQAMTEEIISNLRVRESMLLEMEEMIAAQGVLSPPATLQERARARFLILKFRQSLHPDVIYMRSQIQHHFGQTRSDVDVTPVIRPSNDVIVDAISEARAEGFANQITNAPVGEREAVRSGIMQTLIDEWDAANLPVSIEDQVVNYDGLVGRVFETQDGSFRNKLFRLEGRMGDDIGAEQTLDEIADAAEREMAQRVQDLRDMDAAARAEGTTRDPRTLLEIPGIGKGLILVMENMTPPIRSVQELRDALNAGVDIPGIGPVRTAAIMSPVAESVGKKPIEQISTPIANMVAESYGFHRFSLVLSNPQGRILLNSPSQAAKRMFHILAITDFKMDANYTGDITDESIELGIKIWHRKNEFVLGEIEDQWNRYVMGIGDEITGRTTKLDVAKARVSSQVADQRSVVLTRPEFYEAVTHALRNKGGAVGVPESAIQGVEKSARMMREQILLPAGLALERMGLDIQGVDPFEYVLRLYDTVIIGRDREKFERVIREDLMRKVEAIRGDDGVTIPTNIESRIARLVTKWVNGVMDESYLRTPEGFQEMVQGIEKRVFTDTGQFGRSARRRKLGLLDIRQGEGQKPLRLEVDHETLKPYLRNNIAEIMNAYMHTRIPDIEIRKKFTDIEMTEGFKMIELEYDRLFDEAAANKKLRKIPGAVEKKLKELKNQKGSDLKDLESMRQILRGTYALPASPHSGAGRLQRAGRALRDWNYMRIGGGFGIVALGDIGGMVIMNGARNTMREFANEMRFRTNPTLKKMARQDLQDLMIDFNDTMQMRAMAIADVGDYAMQYSAFEALTHRASKQMAVLSLLGPWTNYAKHIAARQTTRRLIDVALALENGRASPDMMARMQRAHVSPAHMLEILEMFRKYGSDTDGVRSLGVGSWEGPRAPELRRIVRNLIVEDVDRAVVTPGVADAPLLMHSNAGKVIFQFRRFGIAWTQKLGIPAMQGLKAGDYAILNGIGIGIALGSMVFMLKEFSNKREIPTDIDRILQEGIVRADVWGSVGEMDGMLSASTGGAITARGFLGPDTFHGWKSDGFLTNLAGHTLGPSFDTMKQLGRAVGGLGGMAFGEGIGDVTNQQIRAWRKLWPFQNLFYTDFLFDAVQNGVEGAAERGLRHQASLQALGVTPPK